MGQGDLEAKAGMKHQSGVQDGESPETQGSVSYLMGVGSSQGKGLGRPGML